MGKMETKLKRFLFVFLYRFLFFPIFIVLLPYYLLRMIKRGGYKACFYHRFGFLPKNNQKNTLWLQAVSVGELEALQPFLEALQQKKIPVYLTTTTSTGFQIAQKKYANLVSHIAYFPLDFWLFSKLAWHRIQPSMVILMESELWPEHLRQAYNHKIPVYLINGRCSDKTFKHYSKIPGIAKILLSYITKIFAASQLDADRFKRLCPSLTKIETTGNLKVDAALQHLSQDLNAIQRSELGKSWEEATILLGASTWEGEEKLLVDVYLEAKKEFKNLKLLLVPRHAERGESVFSSLQSYSDKICLRTAPIEDADIYIANTTGELKYFIQLADLVFVGKSTGNNFGGQTPIESAAAGKPIVYGSHMENFRAICKSLEQAKGACRCLDEDSVKNQLMAWLKNPQNAIQYGQAAKQWAHDNLGATQRIIEKLF